MIRNIAQAVRQSLNSNPGRANPRLNFSSASNPEAGLSTAPSFGQSNISSSVPVVVTLLSPDENLSRDLFREFGQPSTHYELKTIVGMFNPESCEKLCNGYAPDILLLDLDAIKGNQIAFERFRTQVLHHSPIIALSDNLSVEAVRDLFRLQFSDWLDKTQDIHQLPLAVDRIVQDQWGKVRAPINNGFNSFCLSLLPVKGGVGTTTLAIQMGMQLGKSHNCLDRTCIVDLNFQSGMVADYLNLTASLNLEEIESDLSRLDYQLLENMLARHSSGMSVLAAPQQIGAGAEIGGNFVTSVLDLISSVFAIVVIDLPRHWQPWSNDVLIGSDQVFIVSDFSVPSIKHARHVYDAVSQFDDLSNRTSIIVNKVQQRLINSGLQRSDVDVILNDRLGGYVGADPKLVQEAIDRGLPLSSVKRSNRISKDLSRILEPLPIWNGTA